MIRVAVDAMGGDFAPQEQVLGAMEAVKKCDDIEIILFGRPEEINKYLKPHDRIKIVETRDVIPMGEHDPVRAIRTMKDSSMVKAMTAVAQGEADAFCSSGPTQALVVGAHLIVRRMDGFKRPALAPFIPSFNGGNTIILDSGANLEVKPEQLLQQAYFAHVYAKEVMGIKEPKIGLLNIGTEEGKGRVFENECYKLLSESDLNFVGNVEPKEILNPPCNILISDGFTMNICVKTLEGTAKTMGAMLKRSLMSSFFSKIGALFAKKSLDKFKKDMNPDDASAAMVFGTKYPCVKAHGSSNRIGFSYGILLAASVAREGVIEKVSKALKDSMPQGETNE